MCCFPNGAKTTSVCVCFKVKHKGVLWPKTRPKLKPHLTLPNYATRKNYKSKLQEKIMKKKKALARIPSLGRNLPMTQLDAVSWRQNEPSHFAEFWRGVIRDFWTRKHRGTTLTWPDYNLVFEQEYRDLFSEGGSQKCEFSYDILIFFSSFFLLAVEELRFFVFTSFFKLSIILFIF